MSQARPIKPSVLKPGQTVGIIAPASPLFEEGQLQFVLHWLESLGLKYKLGQHIFAHHSDYAGTDAERIEDLHTAWRDPEVAAVLPIRGGNGAARLLPAIDFDLIAQHPKVFVGCSDITALLIAIYQKSNLVTFHGPTARTIFESAYTFHNFRHAVMSTMPLGQIRDPLKQTVWLPKYPPPRLVIATGACRGPLTGGSLTLIRQLMGTPYEIETAGHLLFLEDVGEEPYSIDSMLCQLLLAGKLQKAVGIIFGESIGCTPGHSRRHVLPLNASVERVLRERLNDLGIPVVYGLRLGHGDEKLTLPIGINASLNVGDEYVTFEIEDSGVIA